MMRKRSSIHSALLTIIVISAPSALAVVELPETSEHQNTIEKGYESQISLLDKQNQELEKQMAQEQSTTHDDATLQRLQNTWDKNVAERQALQQKLKAYKTRVGTISSASTEPLSSSNSSDILLSFKSIASAQELTPQQISKAVSELPQQVLKSMNPSAFKALSPDQRNAFVDNLSSAALTIFVNQDPIQSFKNIGSELINSLHPNQVIALQKGFDVLLTEINKMDVETLTSYEIGTLSALLRKVDTGSLTAHTATLSQIQKKIDDTLASNAGKERMSSADFSYLEMLNNTIKSTINQQNAAAAEKKLAPLANTLQQKTALFAKQSEALHKQLQDILNASPDTDSAQESIEKFNTLNKELSDSVKALAEAAKVFKKAANDDKVWNSSDTQVTKYISSAVDELQETSREQFDGQLEKLQTLFDDYSKKGSTSGKESFLSLIRSAASKVTALLLSTFLSIPEPTVNDLDPKEVRNNAQKANRLLSQELTQIADISSAQDIKRFQQSINDLLPDIAEYLSWRAESLSPVTQEDHTINEKLQNTLNKLNATK